MPTTPTSPNDAIVIGGSYAGMAGALQLARGRRKVAVIDAGIRRNRFAEHSHGVLGQDGKPPAQIAAEAKAQLLLYPNLIWIEGKVESAEKTGDLFTVTTGDNQTLSAKRLLLATGVSDHLPTITGLQDRWGKTVFHCPYCHGYEIGGGPIGNYMSHAVVAMAGNLRAAGGNGFLFANGGFATDNEAQNNEASVRFPG
mgnify:CR=1 FL=1